MKFYDMLSETVITLEDLRDDYETLRNEDPESHAERFEIELFEILMATVNGRNDLEIIDMTPQEVTLFINWLREKIWREEGWS